MAIESRQIARATFTFGLPPEISVAQQNGVSADGYRKSVQITASGGFKTEEEAITAIKKFCLDLYQEATSE